MTKKPYWSGVFPAVTTQLNSDESLNLEATCRHVDALIESRVSGLILLGSLGENQSLAPEEKRTVLRGILEHVRGRVPVLSGVAENSTAAACRFVREAEALGVAGFMVMPAMVYRGDAAEGLAHLRKVAHSTSLPIMIYNNPISYANDVTPDMFAQLAEVPNIVALKESSGNTRRLTDLRNRVGDRFAIFTGVDDLLLESAVLGIDGWVAGAGLAFPKENQLLWDLTRKGDWKRALELYRWFTPLLHLDTHPKFVQYIKLAVQEAGLGSEWVRAPRQVLTGTERAEVLAIIRQGIAQRPELPGVAHEKNQSH